MDESQSHSRRIFHLGNLRRVAGQKSHGHANHPGKCRGLSSRSGFNDQKIGDFYAACMDTSAIEAAGAKPMASDLAAIDALQDRKGLEAEIARLHRETNNVAFSFGAIPDFKNSSQMIGLAHQGGLGLPDRDYYLR